MSEGSLGKCGCQKCGGHLAFALEIQGSEIRCPHCHESTRLLLEEAPGPAFEEPSTSALTLEDVERSFRARIDPPGFAPLYQLGLMLVAGMMILLPVIYLLMVAGTGWWVVQWALHRTRLLRFGLSGAIGYVLPIFAGSILVLFLVKPFFARRSIHHTPLSLNPENEPLLFAFIIRVCTLVGAPPPTRIDLDCQVNASAAFRRGLRSMWGHDLVLTIGLPLVACLDTRQLAGVLAHEFGHFTQGMGMRLSYLIQTINHWFARLVYERDQWDEALAEAAEKSESWAAVMVGAAQIAVFFSRGILFVFMTVAHAISCLMSRQMEYDADRFQIKVAGSECFESTSRRVHVLGARYGDVYKRARVSWNLNRRLPDNLPSLLARFDYALSAERRGKLEDKFGLEQTGLFHTHPSMADRIRRARQMAAPGVVELDVPATMLFANFDAVSRQVTHLHYTEDLHVPIMMGKIVRTEEYDTGLPSV